MSFVDYIIVAVVVLAAVGALIYTHRHSSCNCGTGCASCPRACAQKQKGTSDAPQ